MLRTRHDHRPAFPSAHRERSRARVSGAVRRAILALSLLAPVGATAQANEALNATRVQDFILLQKGASGGIRYATVLDPGLARSHPITDGTLFAVDGGTGANVLLEYLNPLRYRWTFDHKAQPEPLYLAVDQFLSKADQLLAIVNGASPAQGPAAVTEVSGGSGKNQPLSVAARANVMPTEKEAREALTTSKDSITRFHDPELLTWALWISVKPQCLSTQRAVRQQLELHAARLDSLLLAAERPTDSGDRIVTAAQYRATLLHAVDTLSGADSMVALRAALRAASAIHAQLGRANSAGGESVAALLAANASLLAADETGADCRNLAAYTTQVIAQFAARSQHAIGMRTTLLADFGKLLAAIEQQLATAARHGDEFLLGHVSPTAKERSHVTVTIAERKITVTDATLEVKEAATTTATFEVMEHQSVVVDISAGFAYSTVAYPKFRTNQVGSEHFVADAGVDRPRMVAATMLNLIPNTGWSGFTRLVGQVGIGATTESPVILVGGGLRIARNSNTVLSVGAAFPFQKRLKSLKIGEAIAGDADLEKDIERALAKRASLYIGIQR